MWQKLLCHCAVLTKVSEEFAPYYLAEIRHDMRQTTRSLGTPDTVIAATAYLHDYPLLTNNTKDYPMPELTLYKHT